MNIALITAGGRGTRMHQVIPKQFTAVHDKPIIVHTMERFENHPAIDAIAVVCLEHWEDILESYAKRYNISKLKHIIPGGQVGQESIRNGVTELAKHYSAEDIVLVHDAVRPLIPEDLISNCIATTEEKGNAIACVPCLEALLETHDAQTAQQGQNRDYYMRAQAPQGFRLGDLVRVHREALEKGITNTTASCSLMVEMGEKVHLIEGSNFNLKITFPEDLEIFKALLKVKL